MKRTLMFMCLCAVSALISGCSSAQAACPGGNCSRGWGVWSPWVGGYYWQTPCSGGKCQAEKAEPEAAPEEPENPPIEPDCLNLDEPAEQKADATVEPGAENRQPGSGPELVEFKPFCLRVAELVNAQRKAAGLPALELDAKMCDGCDLHSRFMARNGFQHAYYGGRECIAYGVRTPESVVNLWLGSSGHRAILLGGGKTLGVGCSGNYWTLRVR